MEKVVLQKSWLSGRNEAEKLLPEISSALQKCQKTFSDLAAIFVVAGPGSFTGLRVGVTIANALAFAAKVPLLSCDTFQLLHSTIVPAKRTKTAIILAAGGPNIAVLLPTKNKAEIISEEKIKSWLQHAKISYVITGLQPEQRDRVKKNLPPKTMMLAGKNLQTFGQAVKEILGEEWGKRGNFKPVQPIYLRKPNITKSKKENFT